MAGERKAFKDWFDAEAVRRLADQFTAAWPDFDRDRFTALASRGLEKKEMMARVKQISDALADTLPTDREEALDILARSLPPVMPDCEAVTDGWLQWPLGQFIADHGVDHFDAAMTAMIELTQRFSSEFAVRPFVERYPERTVARLTELTTHSSPHVRRWCSEGLRPRLPWGGNLRRFMEDPSPLWPILEALKADPELYVRRSVANNLNDIAKDHPDPVVDRCRAWQGQCADTDWVIRHGLRTLVKQGHPGALELLGYGEPAGIHATLSISPSRIAIGGTIELTLALENRGTEPAALLVDFAVHYVRQRGKTSAKVFKWKTLELAPGETATLKKRHAFKPTTIRALYPGRHKVEVLVNGHCLEGGTFTLGKA